MSTAGPWPFVKRERRPFPTSDVLQAVAFEALIGAMAGRRLLQGKLFDADRIRLMVAVGRIEAAVHEGAGL